MAIFIQIWSPASQKHLTDGCLGSVFTHSRFWCPHSMCYRCSVYLHLLVACGWNQLPLCLTLVCDASQLFITCSSASSNLNVSHHGNRLVSPTEGVSFSVSKPDMHVLCMVVVGKILQNAYENKIGKARKGSFF